MAGSNHEDANGLDDDLLMLAEGGVESDEEDNLSPADSGTPRHHIPSRSPSRSRSRSPTSPQPRHRSLSSNDSKMNSRRRPASRRAKDDSEEEGEA